MLPRDPLENVLYIDLEAKSYRVVPRSDLFERYLGGVGVATALLHEECPHGIDPHDPANPIILAVGPLTGLYPLASKTVAMFKSPHTGNLGESHAGGRSAVAIRSAGYGAIVIKGAFGRFPGYVAVHDGRVYFRDASTLWGMGSCFTVGRIIRENEEAPGLRTIMRIGRAGENLVSYAGVTTETYRHFGRLGLGTVFGSKRLKALVVSGKNTLSVASRSAYRHTYDRIHEAATSSPLMKKYHDLGTAENVAPLNAIGGLPTRNLQSGSLEDPTPITGESLAEHFLGRRLACSHCPVGCIHIASLREPYEDESFFFKTTAIAYDYELLFALGSMLGVTDPKGVLRLIDAVEVVGLDAMSTGVVLAWATEALADGLITLADTGGLELAWGDWATYRRAIARIAERAGDLYRALGRGVAHAAEVYGGREFALAHGGNEMPGYHTGPAAHLGFLIGARHSHLDNAGYSLDQRVLPGGQLTPQAMVDHLLYEEEWRQVLASLVVCFFARGIYAPETVSDALATAGLKLDEAALRALGREIHRAKYRFKVREGFSLHELPIPRRVFETPTPLGRMDESAMRQALNYARSILEPVECRNTSRRPPQ